MVDLDIICAGFAGAMVSSVIFRCLGCTYSNFKSISPRCSSKFLRFKKFFQQNRNQEVLALEKGNENYGQTSSEKAYESAGGISTMASLLLMIVATLAASLTYQAGLNPPGGFFQEAWNIQSAARESEPAAADRSYRKDAVRNDGSALLQIIGSLIFQFNFLSYHERGSALYTAAVLIASTSGFVLVLHLVKKIIFVWYYSNGRRDNMMYNFHGLVDREKLMCTHSSRESDPGAGDDDDDEDDSIIINRNTREQSWTVASAAEHHMTGSLTLLANDCGNYTPMNNNNDDDVVVVVHESGTAAAMVKGNNKKPLRVRGCGSVRTATMALDDVWYVPGLESNLVSTGQLARLGCAVTLGPGGCRITMGDDDELVGTARFVDGHRFELDYLRVPSSSY